MQSKPPPATPRRRSCVFARTSATARTTGVTPVRLVAATAVALATTLAWAAPALAQEPPAPQTAQDKFKAARNYITDGKLDLAAEMLRSFMATPPTDADYLELEKRFGPTVFMRLMRVDAWSENREADKAAKKLVDEIVAKANEANRKVAQDPERVRKYVANLGASPAEKDYAIDQLGPAGAAAVPELVVALRTTKDAALKAGIYEAVPRLSAAVVPPLLAALDPAGDLPDDVRASLLKAIVSRRDIPQLMDKAESNPAPLLWRYAALGGAVVKEASAALLESLTGGLSRKRLADEELQRLADPFVARKGAFGSLDGATNKVTLWVWDAAASGPKAVTLDKADADEFLALKYLRWAVQVNPKSEAAQLTFLAVAAERAVERAGFGDLKTAEPGVYQLLAAASDSALSRLLEQALGEGRTALAVGVLQAMSDRGQKDESDGGKPSPYVRALSDKDVRVQFAAAVALLRNPTPPAVGASARVVDILRRSLAGGDDAGGNPTGRAIIADPMNGRADRVAGQFRDLGYSTEKVTSGRELLRRVARSSDLDLIVLDRHLADPLLNDVLSHLAADPNAGRRPVMLVASTDKPKAPPVEAQLLRLAVLVALTDADDPIPPAYVYDPKFPPTQGPKQNLEMAIETARWDRVDQRNGLLLKAAERRLKRLQRLVEAADLPTSLPLSERLSARLPQLTYGVLFLENDVTGPNPPRPPLESINPAAADALAAARAEYQSKLDEARRTGSKEKIEAPDTPPPDPYLIYADLNEVIRSQVKLNEAIAKITDTAKMGQLVEQIEGQLEPHTRKRGEALLPKIHPAAFLIDGSEYRDRDLEAALAKQVRGFKGVTVIPEPFGPGGLSEDLKKVTADPAARPRSDAEKKATAKLAATWLGKIAQGAVPGYTISDAAQSDMRTALASDDLAPELIDGLAKLGSGDTQVALVQLATSGMRPVPIRTQAADAAARHIQAFGKHTTPATAQLVPTAAADEKDGVLKGKLVVLARLVAEKPSDLGGAVSGFGVTPRVPAPPMPPKDPNDPKDPPKPEKPPEEKK